MEKIKRYLTKFTGWLMGNAAFTGRGDIVTFDQFRCLLVFIYQGYKRKGSFRTYEK